jgi:hypothetical protein
VERVKRGLRLDPEELRAAADILEALAGRAA